MEVIKTS